MDTRDGPGHSAFPWSLTLPSVRRLLAHTVLPLVGDPLRPVTVRSLYTPDYPVSSHLVASYRHPLCGVVLKRLSGLGLPQSLSWVGLPERSPEAIQSVGVDLNMKTQAGRVVATHTQPGCPETGLSSRLGYFARNWSSRPPVRSACLLTCLNVDVTIGANPVWVLRPVRDLKPSGKPRWLRLIARCSCLQTSSGKTHLTLFPCAQIRS